MKNMLTCISAVIVLCGSSTISASQDNDTAAIKSFISRQAARERGEEYEDARKVVAGDLNHDGVSDVAVLYTIESQHGTNNYVQYLAVFIRVKGRLVPVAHTAVGGKSYRAVELRSTTNDVILFDTLNYAAKDAACCPSKKGAARYALVNRRLKEL